jgi:hypothetical protein
MRFIQCVYEKNVYNYYLGEIVMKKSKLIITVATIGFIVLGVSSVLVNLYRDPHDILPELIDSHFSYSGEDLNYLKISSLNWVVGDINYNGEYEATELRSIERTYIYTIVWDCYNQWGRYDGYESMLAIYIPRIENYFSVSFGQTEGDDDYAAIYEFFSESKRILLGNDSINRGAFSEAQVNSILQKIRENFWYVFD